MLRETASGICMGCGGGGVKNGAVCGSCGGSGDGSPGARS